jgi:PilZ domain-containing protein
LDGTARTVLFVDCGNHPLLELATRARRVGFRVLRAKTPEDAREALRDGRHAVAAVVIPPDLEAPDLSLALRGFCELVPDRELAVVVGGARPGPSESERLRGAGAEFALFDPLDDHTLRFQLNRAVAGRTAAAAERRAVRVPTDWPVRVRMGGREKPARVYCVSSTGAFLATARPSFRGSLVYMTLPLPGGPIDVAGRVVMTNVPGNLVKENLPLGMAIQFTGLPLDVGDSLRQYAEHQSGALRV